MAEISHVRIGVPDQASLQRILREGGAQAFPQWLYAEPAPDATILWWAVRGVSSDLLGRLGEPGDLPSRLYPRAVDDWTEPPRGLVLATADVDRAAGRLEGALGLRWLDDHSDPVLSARCRRAAIGRSILAVAEPDGDGYLAESLARHGEGPVAVALDGGGTAGMVADHNAITRGRATYARVGGRTGPVLIFIHVA